MQQWRLIPFFQASGKLQMSIDTWLLEQHRLGLHPPTLRFYGWEPAAISLGYHQRRYPEEWNDLRIDIVRRPSGGRAVLHQGDLTYAVIASGFSGSRMQAYQEICEFLILGMRSLNIPLDYGQAGRGYIQNPNCFGTATAADLITEDGIKLIGSAQLRKGDAILQHGSIRLTPDPDLFRQVFGEAIAQRNLPPIQTVIDALTTAATQVFGAEFEVQALSEEELNQLTVIKFD
jgi:lipoate---protein ligase